METKKQKWIKKQTQAQGNRKAQIKSNHKQMEKKPSRKNRGSKSKKEVIIQNSNYAGSSS